MPDRQNPDRSARVWFRLIRLEARMQAAVGERLREIGVSIPQCDVLTTLTEQEGVSQQELAKRLYVTKGNISGLIDRLAEAGFVERRSTASDRRQHAIYLTEAGRRWRRRRSPSSTAGSPRPLAAWPTPDLEALETQLVALRDIVRERETPALGRAAITDQVNSVAHSNVLQLAILQTVKLSAYTTLIAVPLGVTFALGIHRWRTKTSASFNFVMLLSFVIPELIFGVAMFFVFTSLFRPVGLGTLAETLALVTWNVSWPAIIVQARLASIGDSYSEAAADLGCTPFQTMRRVMLPLLFPAIFASAILVFSSVIDDFVIVDLLSNSAANTPMSVYIYSQQHGGNGGPALNALGTIMLLMSFVIAILGYVGYRAMTRGERGTTTGTLTTIAGA